MRRILLISACLVLAALAATPSRAYSFIMGVGLAVDCYKAAEYGHGSDTAVCDRALEDAMVNHDRAATYVNRSVLRMRGNDIAGALADCDQSIRINSELGEAFVNRGAALMSLHRPAEAIESISHGIALGTHKLHYAYYDRAMAREDLGDVKGAYEDYQKALQVSPDFKLATEQLRRFRVMPASAVHSS